MSHDQEPQQDVRKFTSSGADILSGIRAQPQKWAVFLDIDGTLVDIADTPDEIVVPPELPKHLHQLSRLLGGALALVTGRALPYADKLFFPHQFPIAGLHGAERRSAAGIVDRVEPSSAFEELKTTIAGQARQWPGILIEDKGLAIAAHYRQAPEYQQEVEAMMTHCLDLAGPDFTLQRGKMVLEIRPARASKGEALKAFLSEPPFAGRMPIAIGDDVTDEAMFRVANELGGHSIRIAETTAETLATSVLASAAELRAILATLGAAGPEARNSSGKEPS
jgi:trehalose 6-phosphate phosphatase